jgi:hypothetical protein
MDIETIKQNIAASFTEHRNLYVAAILAFAAGYAVSSFISYLGEDAPVVATGQVPPASADAELDVTHAADHEQLMGLLLEDEAVDEQPETVAEKQEAAATPASSEDSGLQSLLAEVKGERVDVQVLMAGKAAESAKTAKCYKWFKNQEYHAEVVIPESYADSKLWWLRCDASWPEIYLTLEVGGEALKTPVKLVGARRNGKSETPLLLVSQKIAQDLQLKGWQNYRGRAAGVVSLAPAGNR